MVTGKGERDSRAQRERGVKEKSGVLENKSKASQAKETV